MHANPDIDIVAFYNSYVATYFERDVRSLAHRQSGEFRALPAAPAPSALQTC